MLCFSSSDRAAVEAAAVDLLSSQFSFVSKNLKSLFISSIVASGISSSFSSLFPSGFHVHYPIRFMHSWYVLSYSHSAESITMYDWINSVSVMSYLTWLSSVVSLLSSTFSSSDSSMTISIIDSYSCAKLSSA